MKRDRQSVNERQSKILALLRERHEIRVEELAAIFGVSLMTIRRDLQILEDKGLLSRFYGGATIDPASTVHSESDEMKMYQALIERYAAGLVGDGESLFINGSTTALGMLQYIHNREAYVFTNNGLAVSQKFPPDIHITLSGGTLSGPKGILTGDCAMRNLLIEYASKAFIGCSGISPSGEVLCDIPMELSINETMINHSGDYYVLADHTKIGVVSNYASWHLEKMGTVITDELAPTEVVDQLEFIGMTVIRVRKNEFG